MIIPCGLGAVGDAALRGVAEVDGAGCSGGVYGEQGAILGGAELGRQIKLSLRINRSTRLRFTIRPWARRAAVTLR